MPPFQTQLQNITVGPSVSVKISLHIFLLVLCNPGSLHVGIYAALRLPREMAVLRGAYLKEKDEARWWILAEDVITKLVDALTAKDNGAFIIWPSSPAARFWLYPGLLEGSEKASSGFGRVDLHSLSDWSHSLKGFKAPCTHGKSVSYFAPPCPASVKSA